MTTIAWFGKMPRAADFVRGGVSSPAMRAFEDWFHDAYTNLRGAGERGLRYRSVMVLPHAGGSDGFSAAVATPSQDRIGREFPMVVAASLPRHYLGVGSAALSLGLVRFLDAATELFETHRDGEPDSWLHAAASLNPPTVAELSDAKSRWNELRVNLGARQFEQDCFTAPDDRFYAYHTLRLALRDAPSGRVLLCPAAGNPAYRAFWIEAIERTSSADSPLPVLWLDGSGAPSSVLAALGKPPANMLSFALGHNPRSSALWPLTTTHDGAKARSKEALAGSDWDGPEQNLGRLIDTVLSTQV